MWRFPAFALASARDFCAARAPTREEVLDDLALLQKLDPVARCLQEREPGADDIRAYYEHTTYRDYRLLGWLGGDDAMHTPLVRDGPFASPFLESAMLVLSRVSAGSSVLELGCGKGANALFLRTLVPSLRVVGLDLSPVHVRHAKLRAADLGCGDVAFVVGDASALPSAPALRPGAPEPRDAEVAGGFKTVFAIESLCHLTRDAVRRLLAWAFENLEPDGELIVIDGFRREIAAEDDAARSCAEMAERGFRLPGMLGAAEWRSLAEQAGLEVVAREALTREALPFWSRWWRLARVLLRAPALIRAYGASGAPRRRETLANFAAVMGTAPSLALGATEYGMLVFGKPAGGVKEGRGAADSRRVLKRAEMSLEREMREPKRDSVKALNAEPCEETT